MESLPVFADTPSAKAPLRFATIYWSNGIKPAHWWAKGGRASMEFGPSAAPLASCAQDIVFVKGLYNEQAFKNPSPHQGRNANLLSGAWVSTDPSDIRVGVSMDQAIAKEIGSRTAVPSIALGIEPNELRLEDGLSMIYASNISWETATRPSTKEIYPARVFDALVDDGRGRKLDRSILDALLEETNDLKPKISTGDRKKLDEYLESVRSIEKRIDTAGRQERIEGWRPTLAKPNMPRPADEIPQNPPDHMRLMLDSRSRRYCQKASRSLEMRKRSPMRPVKLRIAPSYVDKACMILGSEMAVAGLLVDSDRRAAWTLNMVSSCSLAD